MSDKDENVLVNCIKAMTTLSDHGTARAEFAVLVPKVRRFRGWKNLNNPQKNK